MTFGTPTSVGAGNITTSSTTCSTTVSPADGDCVWAPVFFSNNTSGSISATLGGVSMTQLGSSTFVGTISGNSCYVASFKLEGVSAGAGTAGTNIAVVFTTPTTSVGIKGNAIAYPGVAAGGISAATTAGGTGTSLSVSVSSAAGHRAVNFFGCTSAGISSYNQTSRYVNATTWGALIGDAAGAATVSFTATRTGSGVWGAIGIDLTPDPGLTPGSASVALSGSAPSIGQTVTPASGSVAITGSVPALPQSGELTPGSASVAVSGGTPGLGQTISPAGGSVAVTGGIPAVSNYPSGQLGGILFKLLAGLNAILQIIGDSTAYSAWDAGFSTSPFTPGTLYGWVGRLALLAAEIANAHVVIYLWNYPTNTGYLAPVTLRTATGTGRPTLTVYLGGWPGGVASNYIGSRVAMLPVSNPDAIIINSGLNELSTSNFVTNTVSFIGYAQSMCPGAPIVVTTQNHTTVANEPGHGVTFAQLFAALTANLISGGTLPLSPALQNSTSISGVSLLDTQQANGTTYAGDGYHPDAAGHNAQALFMAYWLLGIINPDSAISGITGGAPGITLTINPARAAVGITGSTPTVGGSSNSAPASAQIGIAGGTPGIGHTVGPTGTSIGIAGSAQGVGQTVQPGDADIDITGGAPEVTGGEDTAETVAGTMTLTNTAGAFMKLANLP